MQDSNASVFAALLNANGIDPADVDVVPVDFDPTPLMNGEVDGFMAYLTNEAITVELAGYEVTNLSYAENGVPYVAETYSVTDQYLAENEDLLKAFLIAEIKGWTDVFKRVDRRHRRARSTSTTTRRRPSRRTASRPSSAPSTRRRPPWGSRPRSC